MNRCRWVLWGLIIIAFAPRSQAADSVAPGAFSRYIEAEHRPILEWETLRGYRLFFHPHDPEPLRRQLTVAVPADEIVTSAWAIVRPVSKEGPYADAWLRVEGSPQPDQERVAISWDGTYQGRPFPDGPYRYEVHLRYKSGREDHWDVQVLKSLGAPLFVTLAGAAIGPHPLEFRHGRFEPVSISADLNRSQGVVQLVARVLAPTVGEPFNTTGLLVQARRVQDAQGQPVAEGWDCLCEQPLPPDSPARVKPKKTACPWDLAHARPGVYDLRLALYHGVKRRGDAAPCDEPILDDDRLRVRVLP